MSGAAAEAGGLFPMPVAAFLKDAEAYLRRGDVVLFKGKASLFSRAIRWSTRSEFSHAALVFAVPSVEEGFERTFLIEAGTSGVDITDLQHYLDKWRVYDIAIKRADYAWMDVGVQRSVRGHMLNFIKAEYDYWTIVAIARAIISNVVFNVAAAVQGVETAVRQSYRWTRRPPSRFVCSGFVQFGFISAVWRLIGNGHTSARIDDVIFRPVLASRLDRAAVLATTPEDLAVSKKLAWKFAIRGGKVHRVDNYEAVKAIFKSR